MADTPAIAAVRHREQYRYLLGLAVIVSIVCDEPEAATVLVLFVPSTLCCQSTWTQGTVVPTVRVAQASLESCLIRRTATIKIVLAPEHNAGRTKCIG
jgi:hypothetical protein